MFRAGVAYESPRASQRERGLRESHRSANHSHVTTPLLQSGGAILTCCISPGTFSAIFLVDLPAKMSDAGDQSGEEVSVLNLYNTGWRKAKKLG